MQEITHVFNRHEIKYILDEAQYQEVMDGIGDHMIPDPHGRSTVCNIYYDTPDDRLVRRSLEGPVYKEKIRLRSYGTAKEDSIVFLELKKKYHGIVYKRRIELPEHSANEYMQGSMPLSKLLESMTEGSSPQIAREIDSFKTFYGSLQPSVYLSYDRSAFYSQEDESLRITFDQNIRYRKDRLKLTEDQDGERLIDSQSHLLEIKTASALPVWLTNVLSKAKVRPSGFSKYGRVYQTLLSSRINSARQVQQETIRLSACNALPVPGISS
ncbi:MAG: polyphosphate polymerase domain-containing protein [Firmicutes bacterium]|nr:polyphosphate polymerase domain-containing protein [Bacillota bacterium]